MEGGLFHLKNSAGENNTIKKPWHDYSEKKTVGHMIIVILKLGNICNNIFFIVLIPIYNSIKYAKATSSNHLKMSTNRTNSGSWLPPCKADYQTNIALFILIIPIV